ncbi:hypothetical protein LIZ64_18850, partial [[Clostridium] hylemonae]|uniref:hypothetical protein n=1 Tax=[Clostridium] hylemonae TaxID=89153 RepID=UPI001D0608E2
YILNKIKIEIDNYNNNNNNISLKYNELLKNIINNLNYKLSNIELNLSNNFYLIDKYLINKYIKYLVPAPAGTPQGEYIKYNS